MSPTSTVPEPADLRPSSATEGRLEAIWIKRFHDGPMDPAPHGRLHAGRGLEGNADQGRKRQVTVISAESWADAEADVGHSVDPSTRRANLLVRGLDLRDSRERVLRVGSCRLKIGGETRPCRRMEESVAGLQAALSREWRGGVYTEVLDDGEIAVGDPVGWE